jgi:hypothetical protein
LTGRAAAVANAFLDAHRNEVARLDIVAPAGTRVYVNGSERARTPLARPLVVPAGAVRLGLVAPGAKPWEESRVLEAQSTLRLAPDLPSAAGVDPAGSLQPWPASPTDSSPSWLGHEPGAVVLLSVATVSLLAGGALTYYSLGKRDDANESHSQITSALQQYVNAGVLSSESVPCGKNGLANGVGTFDPSYSNEQRQVVISEYENACQLHSDQSKSADRARNAAFVSFGVSVAAAATVLTWYLIDGGGGAAEADHGTEAYVPRVIPIVGGAARGILLELNF